jgi:Ca2+-binding RTX toxin-like protein
MTDPYGAYAEGKVTAGIRPGSAGLSRSPTTPGAFDLVVWGTSGDDQIKIYPLANKKDVKVDLNGVNAGKFPPFTGRIVVFGNEGNDRIQVKYLTQTALLYGGAGDDRLDGSRGYDILIGGDGNDRLDGMEKRDIVIGGAGTDRITGGADEDVLIGARPSTTTTRQRAGSACSNCWRRGRERRACRSDRLSCRAMRALGRPARGWGPAL